MIISLRELAEAIGVLVAILIDESTWTDAEATTSKYGRKSKTIGEKRVANFCALVAVT